MEKQQCDPLQKFDKNYKSEILKKRLLKPPSSSSYNILTKNSPQQNVLLSNLRVPTSGSMIVSSMQASQSSLPITHNLVTHSIAPVKIHTGNSSYPLQLSTVHVPLQIPGSASNINVPVQLSGTSNSLQIAPASLPLQVSGTTTVPVQLPAGETINVPLQIPANQNIQLTGTGLPSMPLLQSTNQSLHNSIFHVHMGSNSRTTNMEASSEISVSTSQSQLTEGGVQVKMNSTTVSQVSQVQVSSNQVVQIPSSSSNPIQLTLPNAAGTGTVQLRGAGRPVPHVVYIQTPTGLKPVTSTEVITQASTSGNPPQIIVRRPVPNSSNFHVISNVNKPNIAPKMIGQNKSSLLAPSNAGQPIVIQKPKSSDKMMVPITIAPGTQGKQTVAYLGPVKKGKTLSENQSILISNNQGTVASNNQKLFITPLNMPKIQNTKLILPVTLPATMASKGPIINLQIANGQIQNDPQGNITVMRDAADKHDIPPLQPLSKSVNGKETSLVPQSPKSEKPFSITLMGSRAEPTGEQGEYTLSIPETTASMNDDIFTVSIADGEGGQSQEKSFTLSIPEKGKSLLNKNVVERSDPSPATIAAPAILRRSNSDNSDKKTTNALLKRRISLCTELNKASKINVSPQKVTDKLNSTPDINDDHRVPSLFCDEKMEKDLDAKVNLGESDGEDYKDTKQEYYSKKTEVPIKKAQPVKRETSISEEDPPGLVWNKGVGVLRGSSLHFQTNEFGLIDLVDSTDMDDQPMFQTPLKLRTNSGGQDKKSASPDDLYRCDGCGCHGMAAEFITPNFCSATCQTDVQKMLQKRREIEKAALIRKKNKIKKLLMRKRLSESDIPSDLRDDKELVKYLEEGEAALSEAAMMKLGGEDLAENEKYPWMCGKNGFSWMRYLEVCKAKAAPVKLFKDPFPYGRNGFKVGMRMEAIDPHNPALFCVVSVAEVQGYRMRLHFDEFPDVYDYWVNADCADLYPAGWCERNGRALRPPAALSAATFSWPLYLKQKRAVAAAKHLFPHLTNTQSVKPNGFRIGMKLEAEDRKNELVCVATIADILEHRMRVNFDSWDEQYDYWVDPASPYIHAVGWAEENGHPLTPPNYFKDAESFSWERYLAETGAAAAPPRAFKPRPPHAFKPGMKLEVVDAKVPFLIRVASVSAVKGHQVQVSYDGWPESLAVWMDDDSPDIHPVGWCLKTGHPLEPPLTAEERAVAGPCGVAGCRGLGSARGGGHKQHAAAAACPYRAPPPPPRLPCAARAAPLPATRVSNNKPKPVSSSTPTSDIAKPLRGRPPKHKRVEPVNKVDGSDDESVSSSGGKRFRSETQQSEQERLTEPAAGRELGPDRDRPDRGPLLMFAKYLEALPDNPYEWTEEQVAGVVAGVAGRGGAARAARARLGGAALLLASCGELAAALRLRLGPAVKLHALVRALRPRARPARTSDSFN